MKTTDKKRYNCGTPYIYIPVIKVILCWLNVNIVGGLTSNTLVSNLMQSVLHALNGV